MTVATIKLTKLLYSPEETAALLSVSRSLIYELISSGELLAHCRNGRKNKPVRIVAQSIAAFVDRHQVDPESWHE